MQKIVDSSLGLLWPDPDQEDWYCGSFAAPTGELALNLLTDAAPLEAVISFAEKVTSRVEELIQGAKEKVVSDLLNVTNQSLLQEGQASLSEAQFLAKLKPSAISFYSDDYALIDFDDGGLFGGHSVELQFDDNFVFGEADVF